MSKAYRGRFTGNTSEQSDELLLTSPLGQGVARIVINAEGACSTCPISLRGTRRTPKP